MSLDDDTPEDWEAIDTSDNPIVSSGATQLPMFAFAVSLQEPEGDVSSQQYALSSNPVAALQKQKPPSSSLGQQKQKKVREPKPEFKEVAIDKSALVTKILSNAVGCLDQSIVSAPDPRTPVNIVFIGHVDAGKSTMCGNLLVALGKVDQRTVERYELEAKEKGRESWWLAYIMDQNEDERTKGITIEVGRANFETRSKRFTIFDAPGHKDFVPNMLIGASQADYAALVISARVGEFESGFDRGGQTQEHALLARSSGVEVLIVVVNKMDDQTVAWNYQRFSYIRSSVEPFLRDVCRFNTEKNVFWVPMSGLTGANLHRSAVECEWESGPTLLELLDGLPVPGRSAVEALRIPVLDRIRDKGLWVLGKVESGRVVKSQEVVILPPGLRCEVMDISPSTGSEEFKLAYADQGENLRIRLRLPEDVDVLKGYVLCDPYDLCHVSNLVSAQILILDLLDHKPLITAGYQCVIHIHTAVEDCSVIEVEGAVDPITKRKVKVLYGKTGTRLLVKLMIHQLICVETFEAQPRMGRFTLRDEGKTIAFGKVTRVLSPMDSP